MLHNLITLSPVRNPGVFNKTEKAREPKKVGTPPSTASKKCFQESNCLPATTSVLLREILPPLASVVEFGETKASVLLRTSSRSEFLVLPKEGAREITTA